MNNYQKQMQQHKRIKLEKCFECGRQAEHWHHVVPKCLGGHRCVPLCHECHEKVHSPESTVSLANLRQHGRIPHRATVPLFLDALRLKELGLSLREASGILSIKHSLRVNRQMVHNIWKGGSAIERFYKMMKRLMGEPDILQNLGAFSSGVCWNPRILCPVLPRPTIRSSTIRSVALPEEYPTYCI